MNPKDDLTLEDWRQAAIDWQRRHRAVTEKFHKHLEANKKMRAENARYRRILARIEAALQ